MNQKQRPSRRSGATAERRFAWLAQQRGFIVWPSDRLEEVLTVRRTRPDFFIRRDACAALVEVKSFEQPGPIDAAVARLSPHQYVFSIDPNEHHKRVGAPVRHAARQLADYADLPVARIVVLDNWRQWGIGPLEDLALAVFTASPDAEGAVNRGNVAVLSALLINIPQQRDCDDRFVVERPMRAQVFHNPLASVPLSLDAFAAPEDVSFAFDGRRWVRRPLGP